MHCNNQIDINYLIDRKNSKNILYNYLHNFFIRFYLHSAYYSSQCMINKFEAKNLKRIVWIVGSFTYPGTF